MLAGFGICHHSLVYVYDRLSPWMKKNQLTLKIVDTETYPKELTLDERHDKFLHDYGKAHVLFFDSMTQFKAYAPKLAKKPVIVVLFAAPLQLNQIDGLTIMDCEARDDLSYVFRFTRLELLPIKTLLRKQMAGIKARSTKTHILPTQHVAINFDNLQHIPRLIEMQKQGKVLHLFNLLVTRLTNHTNRTQIKTVLLHHMMGKSSKAEMQRNIAPYLPSRGLGKTLFQDILTFLDSQPGQQLLKALTYISELHKQQEKNKKIKKKPINYKQIAKQFTVDRYELRYIVTAYRQTIAGNTVVRDAKSLAKQYLSQYRKRTEAA